MEWNDVIRSRPLHSRLFLGVRARFEFWASDPKQAEPKKNSRGSYGGTVMLDTGTGLQSRR